MIPEYVGSCAFGLKMGLVLRGSDLLPSIMETLVRADGDGLLCDGDVVCITESIVARAQDNYVTVQEVARELEKKLSVDRDGRIGVVFPITSRNRFSLILKSIAAAVPEGEVIIQLSYPDDEVGNRLIPDSVADELDEERGGCVSVRDLGYKPMHSLTGVDYIELYGEIVSQEGAVPEIFLCNDPVRVLDYEPDGIVAADIHSREQTKRKLAHGHPEVITLQQVFDTPGSGPWSEWGLLGSNMASGNKLKLAPREGNAFVASLQEVVKKKLNKRIEALIYGDGAYKDPSSGIYELADPCAAFGVTKGINGVLRRGVKLKYIVDIYQEQGRSEEEINEIIAEESRAQKSMDSMESEGTTPRRMEDILASLADLVSGSADAGTPLILAKGFL